MAVVYVPADQRWANLGAALGNLAGNAVNAWQDKVVAQGVQGIMSDPNVPQDQKISTITSKYGKAGFDTALNQLKAGLIAQQISASKAAQGLTSAQTTSANIANDVNLQKAPANVQAEYARVKLLQAQTAATQAGAAVDQAKLPLIQQQTNQVGASTANIEQETQGKLLQNQLLTNQLALTHALNSDPSKLTDMLKEQGITDPVEIARVTNAASTGGTKGLQAELDKIAGEHQQFAAQANAAKIRANEPKDLNPKATQAVTNSSQLRASSEAFLKALQADPQTGLASGAPLQAALMHYGVTNPDPNFMSMYEQQLQMVRSTAESGGGFGGQWRINLGKDVSPTVAKTPIANIVSLDAVADRQIAELETLKKTVATNQRMDAVNDELDGWKKMKAFTNSIRNTYTDKNGNTVLMLGGNVIDTNLKPLMEGGSKIYNLSHPGKAPKAGDVSQTGAEIIDKARQLAMNPLDLLRLGEQHYGGTQ